MPWVAEGLLITLVATFLIAIILRRPTAAIARASQFAERLSLARGEVLRATSSTKEIQYLYDSLNRASQKIYEQEQTVQESWLRLSRAQKVAGLSMWEWDATEELLYWSSDMNVVNKTIASDIQAAFSEQVLALVPVCDQEKVFEKLFSG